MTLRDKLEEDIKQSMRERNQARLDALRYLKFAVQAVEKESRKTLDDQGVIEVATKQASDRRDSIAAFRQGGRTELADKEEGDLAVLQEFLPPQLDREEILSLIKQVIAEVGAESPRDKGKVMGRLMPQVRGKADGTVVNEIVTAELESLG